MNRDPIGIAGIYYLAPDALGELSLILWLLIVGVNVQRWTEQASAAGEPDRSVPGRAAV